MGAMFRSETMALGQMFIQPEAAYEVVSELGEAGSVQFRDLNEGVNAFQRHFVSEVRRCNEMERKLRFVEAEMRKEDIEIPTVHVVPRAPERDEIAALEAIIDRTEREVREMTVNAAELRKSYNALTELKHILENTELFFEEAKGLELEQPRKKPRWDDESAAGGVREKLNFVAGVIRRQRIPAFERMLWRVSRGNVYLRRADLEQAIENPYTGVRRLMTAFVVFFQGTELESRVNKICVGFHAKLYPCPVSHAQRKENLCDVRQRLADLETVLEHTNQQRRLALHGVSAVVPFWHIKVKKTKAIYHTLNMFNVDMTHNKCLIAECWVPVADLKSVQKALSDVSMVTGGPIPSFLNTVETKETPPTFNRTNKFTKGFQNLIDSYGIATYREVNPALYTIFTFPFLFAVMFGDVGHGLIMAMFGGAMIYNERRIIERNYKNEIWNIFFAGRYIMLLMGVFSVYTGLIYNDMFSKSLNVFGSKWKGAYSKGAATLSSPITMDPKDAYAKTPYIFGIDPVWEVSKNKIVFLNSYKMKISIIFGVVHMMFGVCLSVVNYRYFEKPASIILVFVPQMTLLMSLFLYLVFMMFFKWCMYSVEAEDVKFQPGCAPSILILFISMMLFSEVKAPDGCDKYMFEGQDYLQIALLLVALLCIPVLLLGSPLHIYYKRRKTRQERSNRTEEPSEPVAMQAGDAQASGSENATTKTNEEEPFSSIMINQSIHTIEYVLSTISHTASYLRLWALSLAHGELSAVLWSMVLSPGLKIKSFYGAITLSITFAAWAAFTIGILVLMEGLSAFLHTLRLHWVEFMSKFYMGLGYPFQPFFFATMLEMDESEEAEQNNPRISFSKS